MAKRLRQMLGPLFKGLERRRHKRAFRFRTDDAQLRVIMWKGKRRVVRLISTRKQGRKKALARMDFVAHSIFHELFPQNSITPVGVTSLAVNGVKKWGMVSEIVRGRSPEYKAYQKWLYSGAEGRPEKVQRHQDFCNKLAIRLARDILLRAGISPSEVQVNICNVNGRPVFFEIDGIDTAQLRSYIDRTVHEPEKRRKLSKLLARLPRHYLSP